MATTKEVQIIARYAHKTNGKLNGTVSYLIRSSNGKSTYCTTLIEGKASGCSCPAKANCYHKKQLEAKEVARQEVAQSFKAQTVPTWTMQLVNTGKLVAPKVVKSDESSTIQPIGSAKDLSTKGNLNGAPTSAKTPAWLAILPSRQALAS